MSDREYLEAVLRELKNANDVIGQFYDDLIGETERRLKKRSTAERKEHSEENPNENSI